MVRHAPIVVLFLAAALDAQELNFRWIDAQGQPRSARQASDVPSTDWPRVSLDVRGTDAISGERFRTAEGITVVIEGIQAPELDDDGTVVSAGGAHARTRLETLVKGASLTLEFEGDRRLPDGEYLAHPKREDGKLLAELLLEEGAVRICLENAAMRHGAGLRSAQVRAQAAQLGVWAKQPQPAPAEPRIHRGVSLGLYAQNSDFDYTGFLDEIRRVGASHVLLAVPWFMEDWESDDLGPVRARTAGWPAVQRVTQQARDRGLLVGYQPLVLLRTGTVEHWRGDIAPTQPWLWFRNYGRFLARFADMGRELGASLLYVGCEFSSLERETKLWRATIAVARSRFGGKLTYSANWDHADAVAFWDDLDFAGTTGFFSLTREDDPTADALAAAWARIKQGLLKFQQSVKKPLLITEIGYPSQDGANKDPWNYFINREEPDEEEQADCFRALFDTWKDLPPGFSGLYVWNWWRHGDPKDDVGYSVFGKPAYEVIRRHYAELADREMRSGKAPK